jgi:ribonucleoside-diphosphate reductase alpha chain
MKEDSIEGIFETLK